MAKIIKDRKREFIEDYHVFYEFNDREGAGYMFECDKHGNVDFSKLSPEGKRNYEECVNGVLDVTFRGINKNVYSYVSPAILQCDCGEHVELYGFTNTCDRCEADYNMGGQRLAPIEQWGEETGEYWIECY